MGGNSSSACGCGRGPPQKLITYPIRNEPWSQAVHNLSLSGMIMLHSQDPDCINDYVSINGDIAIHIVIKQKNFEIFLFLIQYGADIHALDHNGNSCLHLAVIAKDIRIISALFSNDIDDTLMNNDGQTAKNLISDIKFRRQYL